MYDKYRSLIVGDIHGCLDEFRELLQLAQYRPETDRLILLGDLIDKGPYSVDVVKYVRKDIIGAEVIFGNHEEKHSRYRRRTLESKATGKKNPMKPFDAERQAIQDGLTDEDFEWMSKLPRWLPVAHRATGDILDLAAVHAGFEPGPASAFAGFGIAFEGLGKQDEKAMCRIRYVMPDKGEFVGLTEDLKRPTGSIRWAEAWKGPESVVYGHAVYSLDKVTGTGFYTKSAQDYGREGVKAITLDVHEQTDEKGFTMKEWACFGIDTGCCYGGLLTAMEVVHGCDGSIRFIQTKALKQYKKREGGEDE